MTGRASSRGRLAGSLLAAPLTLPLLLCGVSWLEIVVCLAAFGAAGIYLGARWLGEGTERGR